MAGAMGEGLLGGFGEQDSGKRDWTIALDFICLGFFLSLLYNELIGKTGSLQILSVLLLLFLHAENREAVSERQVSS